MPSVDVQKAEGDDGGGGSTHDAAGASEDPSSNPSPSPSPKASRLPVPGLPSWIGAWAKPTVSPALLLDTPQLRDFVALPLPIKSARRRSGAGGSGDAFGFGPSPGSLGYFRATSARASSVGRGGSLRGEGPDASGGGGGGGSSVLTHFMRANSGGASGASGPPPSSNGPLRAFRSSRASFTGSNGTNNGNGNGSGGATGMYGSAAWAWATPGGGAGLGRPPSPVTTAQGLARNGSAGGGGGGGGGPSQRRPMSAGPRRTPLSGGRLTADPGPSAGLPPSAASLSTRSSARGPAGVQSGGYGGPPLRVRTASGNGILKHAVLAPDPGPDPDPAAAAAAAAAAGASSSAAAAASTAAAAAAPEAAAGGSRAGVARLLSSPSRRGPSTALELVGLGPVEEDVGCCVATGDLLLAGEGGPGGPEDAPASEQQPLHIPQAQHMLLGGTLQELCDRLHRSGDRDLHLSLASVSFSGDLDPALGDTIRIQNRTVILHNCTLALKPGQRLSVGPGGNVILADVTVVGIASDQTASCLANPRTLGRPPPSPSPRGVGGAASRGGGGGSGGGGGGSGGSASFGLPLLHATGGGRLLLRGCRSRVHSGGDSSASTPSHSAAATPTPLHRTALPPAATAVLSILADAGGMVEAIGCSLGRCAAAGAGTALTLRRCRLQQGRSCPADAPLLLAAEGALVEVSHTEIRDGAAQGVSAKGSGSRVGLAQSAVVGCRGHGVLVAPGAHVTAAACRFVGNGAAGLSARGFGAEAELRDCELTANTSSNVWVSAGATVGLTACTSTGSVQACGLTVEGAGTRVLSQVCNFDGNLVCGVRVRQGGVVELQDCSASSNGTHGMEVEGTIDADDNAERLAEATLASSAPPPPPLPEVFCLVVGGQLAKNGAHGCAIKAGGGLRIVKGCELSQNGGDGACADGPGCELLLDGCRVLGNAESGLFACSGAAMWVDGCRLGGNLHGDVAVGGRGSRGRLVQCTFEFNPMTALRVHMGAKVALRRCTMEPRPAAAPGSTRTSHRLRQLKGAGEQRHRGGSGGGSGGGGADGSGGDGPGWIVGTVRSQCVQLRGRGTVLSVDGRAFFPVEEEEEDVAAECSGLN